MNKKNIKDIIENYIRNLDFINDDVNKEYTKWISVKYFRDNFDIDAPDFAEMFKKAIKEATWLIDNSRVCPSNGIVKLASNPELTETIRDLFKMLYDDDGGDLKARQSRINKFVTEINNLLDEYESGKWKFKQEFRNALCYLTLMFPADNYFYKYTQAKRFSECIEYGQEIGSGSYFDLGAYYSMCDLLVEQIKNTPELIVEFNKRLKDSMETEDDYHILAFDIIYCAVVYDLYMGIVINKQKKLTEAEKETILKRQGYNEQLMEYRRKFYSLEDDMSEISEINIVGIKINHKKYGEGRVVSQDKSTVEISFNDVTKEFQFPTAFTKGLVSLNDETVAKYFVELYELEKQLKYYGNQIKAVERALQRL